MWKLIKLPYIFERMLGFSLLPAGRVVIVSYDGIHTIELAVSEPPVVHDYDLPEGGTLYNRHAQTLNWEGQALRVLGLHGGSPLVKNHWNETLVLKTQEELLQIVDQVGQVTLSFKYHDLSGDWAYAT